MVYGLVSGWRQNGINRPLQSDHMESMFECVARKAGGCVQSQVSDFHLRCAFYTIPSPKESSVDVHTEHDVSPRENDRTGSSLCSGHTPQYEPPARVLLSFEVASGASITAGRGAERCLREAWGRWVHVNMFFLTPSRKTLAHGFPRTSRRRHVCTSWKVPNSQMQGKRHGFD